jgi:hypothetical protein
MGLTASDPFSGKRTQQTIVNQTGLPKVAPIHEKYYQPHPAYVAPPPEENKVSEKKAEALKAAPAAMAPPPEMMVMPEAPMVTPMGLADAIPGMPRHMGDVIAGQQIAGAQMQRSDLGNSQKLDAWKSKIGAMPAFANANTNTLEAPSKIAHNLAQAKSAESTNKVNTQHERLYGTQADAYTAALKHDPTGLAALGHTPPTKQTKNPLLDSIKASDIPTLDPATAMTLSKAAKDDGNMMLARVLAQQAISKK